MENIEITHKSSFCFVGIGWTGTFEAAAHGDIHRLFYRCKETLQAKGLLEGRTDLIGLSYSDRQNGFTYFLGIEADQKLQVPRDMHSIIVPSYDFVTASHSGPQAWKIYEKLNGWILEQGYHLNHYGGLNHIEVYPIDYDPYRTSLTFQIGIPIKKSRQSVE
ncbi:GyrI-like domain-containing protein [Jeotgalibacillus soli]|uniref:AraC effector-binding domain-containing protein n=1 Tax=Jeotgalibacillus soli TaxID=889306 RepID=A0A0C2VWC6_9BACL|nr:GyrI-like domain-containing protein [Jeotgalibacillus soli]KIL48288.1 hypothetical protein KP78_17350 [Jeotgalibacillus soli]